MSHGKGKQSCAAARGLYITEDEAEGKKGDNNKEACGRQCVLRFVLHHGKVRRRWKSDLIKAMTLAKMPTFLFYARAPLSLRRAACRSHCQITEINNIASRHGSPIIST